MIKVVNISSTTVEIAGVQIKPHTIQLFDDMTIYDRQRLSAMSSVGVIRAYEGDYNSPEAPHQEETTNYTTVAEKPVKKANKKK